MDIPIRKVEQSKRDTIPQDINELGFGKYFSDHIFLLNYNPEKGWHNPRIEPRTDFSLDPAAMVFHYGQAGFEGLKAYQGDKGEIYLFRHLDNLHRMQKTCERLVIPPFDADVVAEGLKKLVDLDKDWIPCTAGCSLYIRPTVIATDPNLGVRPSETYIFYIIVGPVGAYYPEGFNPVSIYVSENYVRAAEGGTGAAKTAGNYAASLLAQQEAKEAGYSQVLWLDAKERRYIEEVGTMNIMFRINDTLVTSPLGGTILPGITRDSVLRVAKHWGWKVEERKLSIEELTEAADNGSLQEMFGTGTAAIIAPVKKFCYRGKEYMVGDGNTGEWAGKLYRYILDLQHGRNEDPFGWREEIG